MDEIKKQEALAKLDHVELMAKVTQAQLRLEKQPDHFLNEVVSGIEWLKSELPSLSDEELAGAMEALIQTAQEAADLIHAKVEDIIKSMPDDTGRETRPL
ncbi:MAG TPA: hypothetical protein DD435_04165 [Cyanobacteria bacterium UBA8530]|nr:hypothetical protein [Cyanobacteria bacterium UBA8530]